MNWPPGTIVVCVDDSPGLEADPLGRLAIGNYYTIRDFIHGRIGPMVVYDEPGVLLMEIIGLPYPYGGEYGLRVDRFRKAESTHSEAGSVRQSAKVGK